MYQAFYGLTEKPFNITPDPKYLYLSPQHQEAISHLLYGIQERGGFVVITGEVGTGKTILCRYILNQLDDQTDGAVILNPNLSGIELLKAINEDFGIQTTGQTKKELIDELNQFLLERRRLGHNMVLVIDEAQNLAPAVLEEIRLLSNLETETEKLIQIILLGQPELRDLLHLPKLRQLNQRVTTRYHLKPLRATETAEYIRHRMAVAGNADAAKFSARTIKKIFAFSGGTPRLINVVCDRLLLAGYASSTRNLTPQMVERAVQEVAGAADHRPSRTALAGRLAVGVAAAAACIALGWFIGGLNVDSWQSAQSAQALIPPPLLSPAPAPPAGAESPAPLPVIAVMKPAEPDPAAEVATPSPARVVPEPPPPAAPVAVAVAATSAAAEPHDATMDVPPPPPTGPAPDPRPANSPIAPAPKPVVVAAAPPPAPPVATAPPAAVGALGSQASEHITAAAGEQERQVISSLFTFTGNRVVTRTPPVIQDVLPPEPVQRVARIPTEPFPTPTLQGTVHLDSKAEVVRFVNGLQPAESRRMAAQGLLSLWGRAFHAPKEAHETGGQDLYKVALNHGMRCSELWLNFDALQQINLPGILELFSPGEAESRYVVLAAIHADGTGTLMWSPTASARVNLAVLDECWRRRVFVFWEEREEVGEVIREGDTGEHVRWLQRSLGALGYYPDEVTGIYGPPTRRAVATFQKAYHLHPDGIVGPRTRMALYSRLAQYPTPTLAPPGETPREHHSRRAQETPS